MTTTPERDWVKEVGEPAAASIREMVAALNCDYDRLEELRESRAALEVEETGNPDADARTLAELQAEWDADNAEELKELEAEAGECTDADEARQRIEDDALSVEVRSDWVSVGSKMEAEEFCILLTTGGPAVRIVGDLERGGPSSATLEVQDWGKPWTEHYISDDAALLDYCRCFYFGD